MLTLVGQLVSSREREKKDSRGDQRKGPRREMGMKVMKQKK